MKDRDVLLCVFSYNMGAALDNCIRYIQELCPGFDVVLVDDASDDSVTLGVIERSAGVFKEVFINRDPKQGRKHGNLYRNIQRMCDYATGNGYRYIFLIQDDTQFVRALSDDVLDQYQAAFDADSMLLQVDPRFLRRGAGIKATDGGYENQASTSYADVGLIHLQRLRESGWQLVEGERANRDGLSALGYRRIFAHTPVLMHVPFPQRYRGGKLKRSLVLRNRGEYGFHLMTPDQIKKMDSRRPEELPYFRKYLMPRNMTPTSWIAFWWCKDSRVLA